MHNILFLSCESTSSDNGPTSGGTVSVDANTRQRNDVAALLCIHEIHMYEKTKIRNMYFRAEEKRINAHSLKPTS